MSKTEELEKLRVSIQGCDKCALCEKRTNIVFGEGNPETQVMFVGEAPGATEDLAGRPFCGRSGKLLDEVLEMHGFDRTNVYIANTVKCRPPENRDPLNLEREACLPILRAQFKIIRPKIVVCVGRIAAMGLISPDFRVSADRGRFFDKNGTLFTAIYHPAAVLRNINLRPDLYLDVRKVRKKLGELSVDDEIKGINPQ
jgi:DNA polymerase